MDDNSPTSPVPGDCYSAGERSWMESGQRLRARLFAPLLSVLTACRVRPDHLTLLSLFCGLAFAPLWYFQHRALAVVALWLHVVLDGLDGPLARFQNCASPRGSFTDSFCDQLVVSAVTISLMVRAPGISTLGGALFLVVYTGVLAMAMVRNTLQIPYAWLLRPRLLLFLAIPLELLGLSKLPELVIWCSNGVLGLKLLTGFWKLRRRLEGPKPESAEPVESASRTETPPDTVTR